MCGPCIDRLRDGSKKAKKKMKCPFCNHENPKFVPVNRVLANFVKNLRYYCINKDTDGCEFQGSLEEIVAHENTNCGARKSFKLSPTCKLCLKKVDAG
jgi:hypothetical protein